MKVLVDTHALFWWLTDDRRLSRAARAAMAEADNDIFVSAATAWELATKVRSGKWPAAIDLATNVTGVLAANEFSPLPITIEHARIAGLLPGRHRDPFDRILAAQAQVEGIALVSADPVFRTFGTQVLW